MLKESLTYLIKIIILFFFLIIFSLGLYFLIIRPSIKLMSGTETLSVEGTAQKYVKPDTALVNVGARFTDSSVSALKKKVDTDISKCKNEIIALGVEEGKIKSNYSIYPEYDYQTGNKLIGYATYATIETTVKDITLVDKILEIAINNNLNVVSNVSFIIEDPDSVKETLRAEAVTEAKAKAQKMADETGIPLGKVINIVEGNTYYPVYRNESMSVGEAVKDSGQSSAITPGEQEITYTVTLVYEINN